MRRHVLPMVAVLVALWPALAMAECKIPPSNASEAEIAELVTCMQAAGETEDAARNEMIVRLRDLYKLLDAAGTKRLDASQDAWLAGAEQACPDQINDEGSIAIEASACRAARYAQRSALLDQVIAGCRAGKCPLDKL